MATDVPMDGRCLLMCGRGGPKAPGLVPVVHTTCPGHKTPWDKAWAREAAKGPLRCFSFTLSGHLPTLPTRALQTVLGRRSRWAGSTLGMPWTPQPLCLPGRSLSTTDLGLTPTLLYSIRRGLLPQRCYLAHACSIYGVIARIRCQRISRSSAQKVASGTSSDTGKLCW